MAESSSVSMTGGELHKNQRDFYNLQSRQNTVCFYMLAFGTLCSQLLPDVFFDG